MKEVISQEVIENFLNGGDPEEFIVGVEYDYPSNKIYKIIQDPVQGKIVKEDTFTPFMWVGDLSGLNFYDVLHNILIQFPSVNELIKSIGNENCIQGVF